MEEMGTGAENFMVWVFLECFIVKYVRWIQSVELKT